MTTTIGGRVGTSIVILAVVLATVGLGAPSGRQAARDPAATRVTGTGVISGVLIAADTQEPIRRAVVTLARTDVRREQLAGTGDDGRFAFAALPPGRYQLSATKNGFVRDVYGSRRPGSGRGPAIVLAEGAHVTLTMPMVRSGAISGTVRLPAGGPASSVRVSAMRYQWVNGARRLVTVGGAYAVDDRGMYRLPRLAPGEYVVSARVAGAGVTHLGEVRTPTELRVVTPEEIQWAIRQMQGGAPTGAPAPAPERGPLQGFAPVFYPGTVDPESAVTVVIAPGEERAGVDVPLQMVPLAAIEGTVVGPDGGPVDGAMAALVPSVATRSNAGVRVGPDGRFTTGTRVLPGRYTLAVRAPAAGPAGLPTPAPPASPGALPALPLWAMQELIVDGRDLTGLVIRLQPGASVSGRVVFDGASPPPPSGAVTLMLTSEPPGGTTAAAAPAGVGSDERFVLSGVAPGRYRLSARLGLRPNAATATWFLRSVTVGGRESADDVITVEPGRDVPEVVVAFTDRPATITGTLVTPGGRPAPECVIAVFPKERRFWTFESRRIGEARPDTTGTFAITGLPPGEYFLAALTDLAPGEIYDPTLLAEIAAQAIVVTLADGERKTQDLRIAGGAGQ